MAVERDTVTFVCTGNTCRSPMAEALLRATLAKRGQGLEKLKVASFGLAAQDGQPVSANSVKAMQRIGLDVAGHRSRPLTQADVDRSAVITRCRSSSSTSSGALPGSAAGMSGGSIGPARYAAHPPRTQT